MYTDLGIAEEDWDSTPQSVKTALIALEHRARLLEIRFAAYEKKLAALAAKDAEIASLRTEVAVLGERLGQNSTNSSRPPSSDPPHVDRPTRREGSGNKRGAQVGHQGAGRPLKPVEEVDQVVDLRPLRCRFVERILSVVATLRQQGRDVLEYLTAASASALGKSGSVCLLPDSS